jgi:lysozyme family protein
MRVPTKKKTAPAPVKIAFIESMECLPVATLPEGEDWSFEIKLYRLATGVWTWNFAGENMR